MPGAIHQCIERSNSILNLSLQALLFFQSGTK